MALSFPTAFTRVHVQEIALWLCKTGYVDFRKADHAGYTGLHESSATGHVNISRILLQYGLDPNAASNHSGIR
jgi:ankyrin repeat protein